MSAADPIRVIHKRDLERDRPTLGQSLRRLRLLQSHQRRNHRQHQGRIQGQDRSRPAIVVDSGTSTGSSEGDSREESYEQEEGVAVYEDDVSTLQDESTVGDSRSASIASQEDYVLRESFPSSAREESFPPPVPEESFSAREESFQSREESDREDNSQAPMPRGGGYDSPRSIHDDESTVDESTFHDESTYDESTLDESTTEDTSEGQSTVESDSDDEHTTDDDESVSDSEDLESSESRDLAASQRFYHSSQSMGPRMTMHEVVQLSLQLQRQRPKFRSTPVSTAKVAAAVVAAVVLVAAEAVPAEVVPAEAPLVGVAVEAVLEVTASLTRAILHANRKEATLF